MKKMGMFNTIGNDEISKLVDKIKFPVKDYRKGVRCPNQVESYEDTLVPDEMYQCLKRNILTNYLITYFEERIASFTQIVGMKTNHSAQELIYNMLFDGKNYGIFKQSCKWLLEENEQFELYVEMFIEDSANYHEFYAELATNDSFLKLAGAVLEKLELKIDSRGCTSFD